jgi:HNH endonuclease
MTDDTYAVELDALHLNRHQINMKVLPIIPGDFSAEQISRFWSRVKKQTDGCWIWQAAILKTGYGNSWFGPRSYLSHRVSYAIANGNLLNNMFVCHKCDVRACVNPDHLFLGTHWDNLRDMDAKGRRREPNQCGERSSRKKLTLQQVNDIRSGKYAGWRVADIAASLGMSIRPIYRIINGESWK